jgi:hypothetical protein
MQKDTYSAGTQGANIWVSLRATGPTEGRYKDRRKESKAALQFKKKCKISEMN